VPVLVINGLPAVLGAAWFFLCQRLIVPGA
jgi:hypothetical protein